MWIELSPEYGGFREVGSTLGIEVWIGDSGVEAWTPETYTAIVPPFDIVYRHGTRATTLERLACLTAEKVIAP